MEYALGFACFAGGLVLGGIGVGVAVMIFHGRIATEIQNTETTLKNYLDAGRNEVRADLATVKKAVDDALAAAEKKL